MNYYYALLTITFFIIAKQSEIGLKLKDSYLSTSIFYIFFTISLLIGYIVLSISLFKNFYWIYAILVFIGGFTVVPFFLDFLIPNKLNKLLMTNIIPFSILVILSVICSILLVINLL